MGEQYRAYKGDTRSLDSSSYKRIASDHAKLLTFCPQQLIPRHSLGRFRVKPSPPENAVLELNPNPQPQGFYLVHESMLECPGRSPDVLLFRERVSM